MNAEPHPAHVRLTLDAIAGAPTDDRIAFAAHVKRHGDGFGATLVAALRQAPQFLAENFPEMPEDERAERLRLCRLWLDFEEAR